MTEFVLCRFPIFVSYFFVNLPLGCLLNYSASYVRAVTFRCRCSRVNFYRASQETCCTGPQLRLDDMIFFAKAWLWGVYVTLLAHVKRGRFKVSVILWLRSLFLRDFKPFWFKIVKKTFNKVWRTSRHHHLSCHLYPWTKECRMSEHLLFQKVAYFLAYYKVLLQFFSLFFLFPLPHHS